MTDLFTLEPTVDFSERRLAMATAAFDGPLCLTRTALHADYSGHLIFHDVIDFHVWSQSDVLSCIVEAGGEVVLPDVVTLAQFKMWMTATTATQDEVKSMTFSSLCAVVEVRSPLFG